MADHVPHSRSVAPRKFTKLMLSNTQTCSALGLYHPHFTISNTLHTGRKGTDPEEDQSILMLTNL